MLKELLTFVTDLKNVYIGLFRTNPVQANISLSLIVVLAILGNLFYFEINKRDVDILYFDKCPKSHSIK